VRKQLCQVLAAAVAVVAIGGFSAKKAQAAPIQLGFALDGSGSLSTTEFAPIRDGLAAAVSNVVPPDGTVEITVVQFSTSVTTHVAPTLITGANKATVVAAIGAISQNGGSTNLHLAINSLVAQLSGSANHDPNESQILNLLTDGIPTDQPAAAAAADAALAGIIDEIDAEAIGAPASAVNFLRDEIVGLSPGPAGGGTVFSPGDVLSAPFVLQVNSFDDVEAALNEKVQFVLDAPLVPEPTSIAIWSLVGLVGCGYGRRRRRAAKAA